MNLKSLRIYVGLAGLALATLIGHAQSVVIGLPSGSGTTDYNALSNKPKLSTGQMLYNQSGDTIASIETACSSLCTYIVTTPQTITLAANHTLSSNVQVDFRAGGKWTVNGAFTLTIPGNVTGTLNQHFAGSSTIAFGQLQQYANVEWFGAVGDGSTNDDTAIQNTLNALSAGQAVLQAKTYSIGTNTLSISKSVVGILGSGLIAVNTSFYTTPPASVILSTSATADILDAWGSSVSSTIYGNKFQNFTLSRNTIPTGSGPAGLSLKYSYGAIIDRVASQDSYYGFYFHGIGSGGVGYINNSIATWGFNGVTETTGQYNGFWFDSANGEPSPSVRMNHDLVASNLTPAANPSEIALAFSGSAFNDFMGFNFESALVNYGVYINGTGTTSIGAQDMHFINFILDNCGTTCFQIVNATQSMNSSIDIDGGWMAKSNVVAAPALNITGSNNINIRDVQMQSVAYDVQVGTSSNIAIVNNNLKGASVAGVRLDGGSDYTVSDNLMRVTGNAIYVDSSAAHLTIANNVINGMTSNAGINIFSGSSDIHGLETNTFDPSVTTPISSAIPFLIPPTGSETVTFSATPTFSNITQSSIITLTANITSFTLAAGLDGQQKMLTFCQNGTGSFTVAAPSNVHGFFTVGATASKCSTQGFTYSAGQTAWLANSSGVTNQ